MTELRLPDIRIPDDLSREDMPDLLRYWYLGTRSRRHMVLRRFHEVDVEIADNDGSVLDIGSAWGYNVMALGKLGRDVVGMDLVPDQFPVGRRVADANDQAFKVLGADAVALPFADGTFRNITMVETFEHVFESDRVEVLKECLRVLENGGRIVLSTPNHGSVVERLKRLLVKVPALQRRLPTMCYPADQVDRDAYHPYQYHQPWTPSQIRTGLESAGFRVRTVKFFLFAYKNAPDGLFPLVSLTERILEKLPVIKRLAATVCLVADKS